MKNRGTGRRQFLKSAAAAGVLALSAGCGVREADSRSTNSAAESKHKSNSSNPKNTVVVAKDSKIWRGDELDSARVKTLLFAAVRALTAANDDASAWYSIFKGSKRAAIKINCIAGRRLSSTPQVAGAVAEGIQLAGAARSDILAFDRTEREVIKAGFNIGDNPNGLYAAATDSPRFGYDEELSVSGEAGSLVSRIVSTWCDTLVNIPVLKDQDLVGVSGALKNNFGCINNPNKLHENGCDPYVADLNTLPAFRNKTRLVVCDGSLGQYHGGPGYKSNYAWRFSGLIVSTDPVAADTVEHKIIREKRAAAGLPTLEKEDRAPKYLATAAARGLGEHRLDHIKIINVNL